uniref:Ribosomal protein S4 n=1 Tax=Toxarium undulatum TaxID=210620 RepID=A0A2U9GI13_9STRA|nr:ribosomal protein S4 [Toxarium undulatum]AWQ64117.1 ribosomal protein S4 [Toxarium undulatum]
MVKTQTRYKPFYKRLTALKRNVLLFNTRKILKFKKKKWETVIFHFNKAAYPKYRKQKFYDHNKYALKRFSIYLKRRYKNKVIVRNRLKLFYFNLKKKYVKKILKLKPKYIKFQANYFFLQFLESRLDVVLYRARFTQNLRTARILIKNKKVYVNKQLVTYPLFILKPGDLIEICRNYWTRIRKEVKKVLKMRYSVLSHLQINYRVLQIIFLGNFKTSNFTTLYPFWVDLNTWIKSYKY